MSTSEQESDGCQRISKIHLLRIRGTDVFAWNEVDALQCKQMAFFQISNDKYNTSGVLIIIIFINSALLHN